MPNLPEQAIQKTLKITKDSGNSIPDTDLIQKTRQVFFEYN